MMILILMLMFLSYLLNQVYLVKTLDSITVALARGARITVRNGKLFVITNVEMPSADDSVRYSMFLDKKQFISALLKHNGASKFVNDKLVEEMDIKRGNDYVTTKVYNDYAVAYAASHCVFCVSPVLMEAGDTYNKADGEVGVIETNFIKFDIIDVIPDDDMSAALTKYAAAERDFFGF